MNNHIITIKSELIKLAGQPDAFEKFIKFYLQFPAFHATMSQSIFFYKANLSSIYLNLFSENPCF